jgi:hypothetical protein
MSYAGVARRTVQPDPNVAGSAERPDPYVADTATSAPGVIRNPYVGVGAATSYAGVAQQSVIRNPYVAGAAAGAAAGVYNDCQQTTDEYGNVFTQC